MNDDTTLARSTGITNPLTLIDRAIERGIKPDELGKLLDLQERWERNRAAERFAEAITAFQKECPQVEKTKNVEGKYNYAPYEEVMKTAGPIMVRHAIVATFSTERVELGVKITCRIRVGMHSEETTLTVPVPAGNKLVNETQLMGQALSYAKRYALCAALNIVTKAEDNDASACLDTLIAEEVEELKDMIEAKGADMALFLQFAQEMAKVPVEDLASIPRKCFPRLMDALKHKKPGTPPARKEGAK